MEYSVIGWPCSSRGCHRERLCRYLLRPPLAQGRLVERNDGHNAFQMKSPWPDGTSVLVVNGVELIGRLAALVPPPKLHAVPGNPRPLGVTFEPPNGCQPTLLVGQAYGKRLLDVPKKGAILVKSPCCLPI